MSAGALPVRDAAPGAWRRLSVRLRAGLCAVLLVLLSFPDVIASGATLVNSAGYFGALYGTPMSALYPERAGRSYHHGYNDAGGAVWQSDPMRGYMGRLVRSSESPYWNPYSATGALGPETLVDQKFSPITLAAAALGGDQWAADAALLLFFTLALYCLYLVVAVDLALAEGAAVAAGIVYLLGGFNIANLGSNVVHAYVLFPLLLGALMAYVRRPSGARFMAAVGANALVLATTFLPVAFLTFAAVYTLAAAYGLPAAAAQGPRTRAQRARILATLAASFLVAALCLAPLYLPIIESLSLVDSVDMYSKRVFMPVDLHNLVGLLSPKQFWESYAAIDPQLLAAPPVGLGNGAFHFGIVAVVLAALAMTGTRSRHWPVLAAAALLCVTALGRIYDIAPVAQIVGHLYGVSSLGCQYWWAMAAITLPILCAFGFEALSAGNRKVLALVAAYILIIGAFVLAYRIYGWQEGRILLQLWYLMVALFIATAAGLLAARAGGPRGKVRRAALLVLLFLELTFYMNHLRPMRNDEAQVPPGLLAFLRQHIGDYRLANFGPFGIPPEWGSAYGIPEVGSMNMSILPWYKTLFEQAFGLPTPRPWGNFASLHYPVSPAKLNDQVLDLMAVKYLFIPARWQDYHDLIAEGRYCDVYSDTYGTLYANQDVCPRVYVAPTWIRHPGVPDVIPGSACRSVYTDDPELIAAARRLGIAERTAPPPGSSRGGAPVSGLRVHNTWLRFRVSLDAPAVVVLADAWHPNWRTRVDKQPVHTGLVNGSFRGIALPAGEHLVEMSYRPRSLPAALGIAGVTLLLLILIPLRNRRRRNRAWGRSATAG